ncbi:Hypothetical protein SMAX5B_018112 [Scophthalmus maximus]|uniref:Uncharacterized protein n=1 Tax=Scophthalmus maximus TaxID=52904 RepID=A0A2U9CGC5_SCOMX|nr:Hypothetical protein SMAX5B_018112 [Scophthalmus maximus]
MCEYEMSGNAAHIGSALIVGVEFVLVSCLYKNKQRCRSVHRTFSCSTGQRFSKSEENRTRDEHKRLAPQPEVTLTPLRRPEKRARRQLRRENAEGCSIEGFTPMKHDSLAMTKMNPFREMDAIQQSAVYGGKICKQGKSRVLVVVEEEEVLEQQTMLCDLQSVVLSGI